MGGGGLVEANEEIERARALLANGVEFLPSPARADTGDPRDTCYMTAIAAELGLKAYLSSQGWSDDRCRRDVRHDLETGLAQAYKSGMVGTGDELADVIVVLNVYYPHHAFDRFDGDPAFASKARAAVAGLLDAVHPYVEASGGR
jgi:hypothetical protein